MRNRTMTLNRVRSKPGSGSFSLAARRRLQALACLCAGTVLQSDLHRRSSMPMSSRTLQPILGAASLGFAALLLAAPAYAGTVYQWKDARGVTHYSDSPPPEQQGVQNRHLKDGPAPTEAAARPKEDPNCVTARGNLARLKGNQPVGLDGNGDGKPDSEMSAEDRARQIQQTEQMLKTSCDKPAAAP
jgi:hypothetical protein